MGLKVEITPLVKSRSSRGNSTQQLYLLKDGVLGHLEVIWERREVGIISSINSVRHINSGFHSQL